MSEGEQKLVDTGGDYLYAIKDGQLSPGIRDQLRRRAKAWLRRYLSQPDSA